METIPRIYVACLSAYNAGKLHGAWIECNKPVELIEKEIKDMLRASPESNAEEYAIHDYEGFHEIKISENHCSLDEIVSIVEAIDRRGDAFLAAMRLFYKYEYAIKKLDNCYLGCYDSFSDYCEEEFSDLYEDVIPADLRPYIDMKAYERDRAIELYHTDVNGKCYIFAARRL